MSTFVKTTMVNAPVEQVFAFHERPDALQLLSPGFPPLRIIKKHGGIETGSCVEFRIGPFDWVALHSAFEKNRFFEDRQIRGPFSQWVHRHDFEAIGEKTRLTDRIQFRMRGGALVNLVFGWIVKLGLYQLFLQRHRTTKRYCEGGR